MKEPKIKANELMVDDWVIVPGCGRRERVTDIMTDADGVALIWTSGETLNHIEELEPVPITQKILHKNGIQYQWDNPWYQYGADEGYELHIGKCIMQVAYVHELQHALRLCKINKDIII